MKAINKKYLIGLFLMVCLSSVAQMLLPALLADMLQEGVVLHHVNPIVFYGLLMALVAILSGVVGYFSMKFTSLISTDYAAKLRLDMFKKVQSFGASEMDRFSCASLVTRSTADISQIQNFLTLVLRVGLLAPMMAIAGLLFSLKSGGQVSLVLVVAIPLLIIILALLMVLASRYSLRLRKQLDRLNHRFLESLEGVRVIRAFHKQKRECERFSKVNGEYTSTAMCVGRIGSLFMPSISLIFGLTNVAVLGIGSYYVKNGFLNVTGLVAQSQYLSMVLTSVMMLSVVIMMFPTSYACFNRIKEVLDVKLSMEDGEIDLNQRSLRHSVEFRNVTFAYPMAAQPVLKDMSFIAKSGEVTAIIGGTGRGKSSILKLIPRLYDPLFGEVLVDGVNVKDYRINDLRSMIGYVPQKSILFSGDIASNLNFGNVNGCLTDWQLACQIACADEFIMNKPHQYHESMAQGGGNLSGGQKQRLSIARAFMKKPEIYLFDDSFSALDMKTEQKLRHNIKAILKDEIVIMVAQRVSSIKDADQIIVIDDGGIVGKGSHEQLLVSCALYRDIVKEQLGREAL